jgi:hypothetical protein
MNTEAWITIGISVVGVVYTFIMQGNRISILESEIRRKDEQISDLKHQNDLLWSRVNETK